MVWGRRVGVVVAATIATLAALVSPVRGAAQAGPPEVVDVEVLAFNGGRVDWAPDGSALAADRAGDDGFFDVWILGLDGTERCLTCAHETLGLPPGHKGNPSFHPSGEWLVFQVEQPDHVGPQGSFLASPGAGAYNDLWLMRVDASEAVELVHHDLSTPGRGSLHPHFDSTGRWLTWAQLIRGQGQPADAMDDPATVANDRAVSLTSGEWEIALAHVDFDATVPTAGPARTFQPGGRAFYETHEVTRGGRKILYSANPDPHQQVGGMDIFELDTSTGTVTRRFTHSPDVWDEHAHYASKRNGEVLYASGPLAPHDDHLYPGPPVAIGAFVATPQLDLYLTGLAGERHRVTHFADREWEHHIEGSFGASVVDNAISPDGRTVAALLLLRSIGPFIRQNHLQPVVLIHLSSPLS